MQPKQKTEPNQLLEELTKSLRGNGEGVASQGSLLYRRPGDELEARDVHARSEAKWLEILMMLLPLEGHEDTWECMHPAT